MGSDKEYRVVDKVQRLHESDQVGQTVRLIKLLSNVVLLMFIGQVSHVQEGREL